MGGNALKDSKVKLRRMVTQDVVALQSEVLAAIVERWHATAVRPLADKNVHGDLDILLRLPVQTKADSLYEHTFRDVRAFVQEKFAPSVMKCAPNSNVITFNHRSFQVDIICVPKAYYAFAEMYYSYSDFGSLAGTMANYLGLKLGFDGLFFRKTATLPEILITQDPDTALQILGFQKWPDTMTRSELFDYILTSDLFCWDAFEEDSKKRAREKNKRTTYTSFLHAIDSMEHDYKDRAALIHIVRERVERYAPVDNEQHIAAHALTQHKALFRSTATSMGQAAGYRNAKLGDWLNFVNRHVSGFDDTTWVYLMDYEAPSDFVELLRLLLRSYQSKE